MFRCSDLLPFAFALAALTGCGQQAVPTNATGGDGAVQLKSQASQLGLPVPESVIVSQDGLEWVYASPCADGGYSSILVGHEGFGYATEAQWAKRPPVSAFSSKCAAPWFDKVHNHCDFGNLEVNLYGSAPTGGLPTATGEAMNGFSDTLLVRTPSTPDATKPVATLTTPAD